MIRAWISFALPLLAAAPPEAREIILQSLSREWRDLEAQRHYTFVRQTEEKHFDSHGQVRKLERRTHDVTILHGRPYSRLIAEDGKPLSPERERREQEKLDRELERRARETEKERRDREEEQRKSMEEEKKLRGEIADAYHFTLLGEDTVSGRPVWVVQADPKPGYRPRSSRARILPKMRGKLWISQADYRWVRLEAEVIDTFSLGVLLLRLNPGTRMSFEQTLVRDEVWMPRRAWIRGHARLALVKKYDVEVNTTWENYRRFSADSRVVATGEAAQP